MQISETHLYSLFRDFWTCTITDHCAVSYIYQQTSESVLSVWTSQERQSREKEVREVRKGGGWGGGRAVVELSKRGRLVCAYQSAVSYASPRVSRVALVRAPLRKDDHTNLAGCLLLGHLERPVGDFGMYCILPVFANRNVLAKENGWTPWGLVDVWAS